MGSQDRNHLVVDGSNVCYRLYGGYTWLLGGEYKAYSLRVREFFEELKTHFKNPVVVIDGGKFGCGVRKTRDIPNKRLTASMKMQRLQTKEEWEFRAAGHDELNTARMLISAFKDVLHTLDIDFYFVESDADNVVAGLARHYKCPILSSDADFFIFEVVGFIQLDHWLQKKINAPMYKIEMFMKQFSLVEHEQCILIPAILGNDFGVEMPGVAKLSICELLSDISKHSSCQEFLQSQDPNIRQSFEEAKKFYLNVTCPPHFPDAEDLVAAASDEVVISTGASEEVTKVGTIEKASTSATCESTTASCHEKVHIAVNDGPMSLPKWVFEKFESGCFLTYLIKVHHVKFCRLPPTVEVIEKESAWKISRGIRQFLYGFMGIPPDIKINEIIREDYLPSFNNEDPVSVRNFAKNPISITNHIFTNPDDHKDELQDLVLTVLNCHKIPAGDIQRIFKPMEDKWKLPIAATFHWYRHKSTPRDQRENLLKCLLLSFLACSGVISNYVPSLPPVNARTKSRHLTALHSFAQWQCVYFDAMALNYLAREPLPTTSPASLYSGKVAMYYATNVSHVGDWIACSITKGSRGWDILNDILYLVTGKDENGRCRRENPWTVVGHAS